MSEYINEFHRQWIEKTKKSIEEWKNKPYTKFQVLEQQRKLNKQRAERERKSKTVAQFE